MKTKKQTKKSNNRFKASQKWWLVTVAVVLLIAAGAAAYHAQHTKQVAKQPQVSDKIDNSPATKAEQQESNQDKEADINTESTPPASTATVLVSDASQYGDTIEVRAYVSNAVESGGTCTVTFTQGASSFSVTNTASAAASSTQCGAIDVPVSRFATKGAWNVVVQYSSTKLTGQSQATTVTVQ